MTDAERPDVPEIDVPEIGIAELARLHAGGSFVLDVREPEEYDEAHVPGAVPIPLGQVAERSAEVPADRDVYVVCGSGGRSARATGILNAAGRSATNVAGGTKGWIAAGHQVESGPSHGA